MLACCWGEWQDLGLRSPARTRRPHLPAGRWTSEFLDREAWTKRMTCVGISWIHIFGQYFFFINLNESNHIFQKILLFLVNCSAAELLLTQQRDGLLNFNIKDYHYVLFVNVYICIFSSVRSSNSHPDLLLTHQHQHPHFFRSHRSSTLDFHFLSHYSYIKAIKLYKGNHWTHLLATCIPYGYNRTSLQESAR